MKRIVILAALLIACVATLHARTITVQGTGGTCNSGLITGTQTVTVLVYNSSSGGTLQWSQDYSGVSFSSSSVFSFTGVDIPATYFTGGYYIGLKVVGSGCGESSTRFELGMGDTYAVQGCVCTWVWIAQ